MRVVTQRKLFLRSVRIMRNALLFFERMLPEPILHALATSPFGAIRISRQQMTVFALTSVALAIGFAFAHSTDKGALGFAHGFIGFVLVLFSLFKLAHPLKFLNSFATYDSIATYWRGYAFIIIAAELMLGVAFLSFWQPAPTYMLCVMISASALLGLAATMKEENDPVITYGPSRILGVTPRFAATLEHGVIGSASLILLLTGSF